MNETNPVNSATKHNGVPTWRASTVLWHDEILC